MRRGLKRTDTKRKMTRHSAAIKRTRRNTATAGVRSSARIVQMRLQQRKAEAEAEVARLEADFPYLAALKLSADQWLDIEAPLAAVGLRGADVLAFGEGTRCSFWFLRADKLRGFTGRTPPKLQELRR